MYREELIQIQRDRIGFTVVSTANLREGSYYSEQMGKQDYLLWNM
jgi:hypothetical protein